MTTYLQRLLNTPIPPSEPYDARMVANDGGGYGYPVNDAVRMHRFLIMGSEYGSAYQTERKLTLENAASTRRHIAADGVNAVAHMVNIARERRAPRVSPILFCLAIAASADEPATRAAALAALPQVASTASHLEEFAGYVDSMRGWGRSLRTAVSSWYTEQEVSDVAFQAVKYRTRAGWSHRDLLAKAHPRSEDDSDLHHLFRWIYKDVIPPERDSLQIVHAFESAQTITDPKQLAALITRTRLPREAVPPAMLQHHQVWQALGPLMPPLAFIRNLPALTSHQAIQPMEYQWALDRINSFRSHVNADGYTRPAPVHPVNILLAMMVYRMGKSIEGKSTWKPVPQISAALDEAFDLSFSAAAQTGQRIYLAVDVSRSMSHHTLNKVHGLTAAMAAAAVTMAMARREPRYYVTAFSDQMRPFNITAQDSLRDVMDITNRINMGATDLALPMLDAMQHSIPVDCFIIATDGETNTGPIHPVEALKRYRQKMGIPAKAVQLAFVANRISIMDPDDAGTMDLAGFDGAIPTLLHDFMTA